MSSESSLRRSVPRRMCVHRRYAEHRGACPATPARSSLPVSSPPLCPPSRSLGPPLHAPLYSAMQLAQSQVALTEAQRVAREEVDGLQAQLRQAQADASTWTDKVGIPEAHHLLGGDPCVQGRLE